MSRIGKEPITIPSGVTLSVDKDFITVSGPKGSLQQFTMPDITVKAGERDIQVTRSSNEPKVRARHGLMRQLIQNMVTGVSQGYERKLELNGVGYRVAPQGQDLKFNLGFSHDVIYKVPAGIQVS